MIISDRTSIILKDKVDFLPKPEPYVYLLENPAYKVEQAWRIFGFEVREVGIIKVSKIKHGDLIAKQIGRKLYIMRVIGTYSAKDQCFLKFDKILELEF